MYRLLGFLLVVHGLAHASAGMWAAGTAESLGLVTTLWTIATAGFLAAGFGRLGLRGARRWWRHLGILAAASSFVLLVFYSTRPLFLVGAVIDVALVALFAFWREPTPEPAPAAAAGSAPPAPRHVRWRAAGTGLAYTFLGLTTLQLATRPLQMRWGSLPEERLASVPGDTLSAARYRIDHGITIRAPADEVWPWIAQIGQDRGGFYSYDWIERAFGDDVRNADRIHPEWQERKVGDLVPATQPGYLGIFETPVGWRVAQFEPQHHLVLENWGAFIVEPIDSTTSRLIVRTRGDGEPRAYHVVLAPVGLLIFEPAHFVMERRMLLGVRERAERARGS